VVANAASHGFSGSTKATKTITKITLDGIAGSILSIYKRSCNAIGISFLLLGSESYHQRDGTSFVSFFAFRRHTGFNALLTTTCWKCIMPTAIVLVRLASVLQLLYFQQNSDTLFPTVASGPLEAHLGIEGSGLHFCQRTIVKPKTTATQQHSCHALKPNGCSG
jgi:hypothetical protein